MCLCLGILSEAGCCFIGMVWNRKTLPGLQNIMTWTLFHSAVVWKRFFWWRRTSLGLTWDDWQLSSSLRHQHTFLHLIGQTLQTVIGISKNLYSLKSVSESTSAAEKEFCVLRSVIASFKSEGGSRRLILDLITAVNIFLIVNKYHVCTNPQCFFAFRQHFLTSLPLAGLWQNPGLLHESRTCATWLHTLTFCVSIQNLLYWHWTLVLNVNRELQNWPKCTEIHGYWTTAVLGPSPLVTAYIFKSKIYSVI